MVSDGESDGHKRLDRLTVGVICCAAGEGEGMGWQMAEPVCVYERMGQVVVSGDHVTMVPYVVAHAPSHWEWEYKEWTSLLCYSTHVAPYLC